MTKIKKILLALDETKLRNRILDHGIKLANQFDAKLTGIHVIPVIPSYSTVALPGVRKAMIKDTDKFLSKMKEQSLKNKAPFDYQILHGHPGTKIAEFAKEKKYDLIVIGSYGPSKLKEVFLGSTSNTVLHKTKIPTLIVKR